MRTYKDIADILRYCVDHHKFLNKTGYGAHGYKFIRKDDGSKIPFEITKGFKIFSFNAFKDTVTIDQLITAYTFDGQIKQTITSTLYLTDLLAINVYDDKTDFISLSSIDFTYIVNHKDTEIICLTEWTTESYGPLRASWISDRPNIDEILDGIINRKTKLPKRRRLIDLDCDIGDKYGN